MRVMTNTRQARPDTLSFRQGREVVISWSGCGTVPVAGRISGLGQDIGGATNPAVAIHPVSQVGEPFCQVRP